MNTILLENGPLQTFALLALEVALIALALLATRPFRISARVRRSLSQAAFIALLVSITLELSGIGRSASQTLVHSFQRRPAFSLSLAMPKPLSSEGESSVPFSSSFSFSSSIPASPSTPPTRALPPSAFSTPNFWLPVCWFAGIAVFALRALVLRCVSLLFRLRARPVTTPNLNARVRSLADAIGFRASVRLVQSPRLHSPIAFGLLRPTIGLPLAFSSQFPERKQDAILAHELAHLAARDPLWFLLADVITTLLWWHPAVWWLRRELTLASESAADEASVVVAGGAGLLAECLVELGARLVPSATTLPLGMAGYRSHLGARVQRLLHLDTNEWQAPNRSRELLLKLLAPVGMSALVILSTAWALPQDLNKAQTMKSIQKNWTQTLAAFSLLIAGSEPALAADAPPAIADLHHVGDEVTSPSPLAPNAPATVPDPPPPPAAFTPAPAGNSISAIPQRAARFPSSPGTTAALPPPPGYYASRPVPLPPGYGSVAGSAVEAKLREIVLPEVMFDNLPLSEVLAFLSQESVKRDPEKKGINFLINPNAPASPMPIGTVDPATGLPVSPTATESVDVGSIAIKFNLPLHHVTMRDALEAVVKVADRPLQYSLEDYGVILSIKGDGPPLAINASRPQVPTLTVRTFRVDTNTFVGGLESAFGIKVPSSNKDGTDGRSPKIQAALKQLLKQVGVEMEPNKSVFYNELTGMVMVRATPQDLELVRAAIETLGGVEYGSNASGMSPGLGMVPRMPGR
ncbi:MAG TPA: M56 family metallopeptidase [Candidatus Dormibacteraeota bacterium]|nr:M56 family metallopeptidase [Candidatus Dormibacteraeota bacterium]